MLEGERRTDEVCEKESVIDGENFIIPIFIPILIPTYYCIIDDWDWDSNL